jgi:hypothetical protein
MSWPRVTPPCCEVWPKILGVFSWMHFEEHPDFYTMANIRAAGTPWRINHCPACGEKVNQAIVSGEMIEESRAGL